MSSTYQPSFRYLACNVALSAVKPRFSEMLPLVNIDFLCNADLVWCQRFCHCPRFALVKKHIFHRCHEQDLLNVASLCQRLYVARLIECSPCQCFPGLDVLSVGSSADTGTSVFEMIYLLQSCDVIVKTSSTLPTSHA